jgi:hypothetical protein
MDFISIILLSVFNRFLSLQELGVSMKEHGRHLRNPSVNVFFRDGIEFSHHRSCFGPLGPENSWRAASKRQRLSRKRRRGWWAAWTAASVGGGGGVTGYGLRATGHIWPTICTLLFMYFSVCRLLFRPGPHKSLRPTIAGPTFIGGASHFLHTLAAHSHNPRRILLICWTPTRLRGPPWGPCVPTRDQL